MQLSHQRFEIAEIDPVPYVEWAHAASNNSCKQREQKKALHFAELLFIAHLKKYKILRDEVLGLT